MKRSLTAACVAALAALITTAANAGWFGKDPIEALKLKLTEEATNSATYLRGVDYDKVLSGGAFVLAPIFTKANITTKVLMKTADTGVAIIDAAVILRRTGESLKFEWARCDVSVRGETVYDCKASNDTAALFQEANRNTWRHGLSMPVLMTKEDVEGFKREDEKAEQRIAEGAAKEAAKKKEENEAAAKRNAEYHRRQVAKVSAELVEAKKTMEAKLEYAKALKAKSDEATEAAEEAEAQAHCGYTLIEGPAAAPKAKRPCKPKGPQSFDEANREAVALQQVKGRAHDAARKYGDAQGAADNAVVAYKNALTQAKHLGLREEVEDAAIGGLNRPGFAGGWLV